MNEIQIFNFQGSDVRVVDINNEPWFIAKDVCGALELATNHIPEILDGDEISSIDPNLLNLDIGIGRVLNEHTIGKNIKTVVPEAGKGGKPLTLINESGLYSLVLRSRKPEAKALKKWVTSEVLPAIRRNGVYYPATRIREKGYCDFHVVPYLNSQGDRMPREHLKWTESGRRAIIELWNKRHPAA